MYKKKYLFIYTTKILHLMDVHRFKDVESACDSRDMPFLYTWHVIFYIRLSEKCLSFTDTSFTTLHFYTNMEPDLSKVVIFILIEQNRSYVIR